MVVPFMITVDVKYSLLLLLFVIQGCRLFTFLTLSLSSKKDCGFRYEKWAFTTVQKQDS